MLDIVYPIKTKNNDDSTDALCLFANNVRIYAKHKPDITATFVGQHKDFKALVCKLGINMTFAKPYCHNQIQSVDIAIQDLKQGWCSKMRKQNIAW